MFPIQIGWNWNEFNKQVAIVGNLMRKMGKETHRKMTNEKRKRNKNVSTANQDFYINGLQQPFKKDGSLSSAAEKENQMVTRSHFFFHQIPISCTWKSGLFQRISVGEAR